MSLKWNPFTGALDYSSTHGGGSAQDALSAKTLKIQLNANDNISALKAIYQVSPEAGDNADYRIESKKDVIGISLTAAVTGNQFDVLLFGRIEDNGFNYEVNELLFLGQDGNITNVAPASGYSVLIGKGLGAGAIFINIERPIQI